MLASVRQIITPLRRQQFELLSAVLARLDGEPATLAPWSLGEVTLTGVATGLTALAGQLGLFEAASPEVIALVAEQREQVSQRVHQYMQLLPTVMAALDAAAVLAVAVKGAALLQSVWGANGTRPMADIDVIVPAAQRGQAAAAMVAAGLRPIDSSRFEDTFLAWGDGGVGRTDGESADHNGRVEVHPGWIEFLHGYVVHGFAVESTPFDHEALTTHVLGHLASTVVRGEVRAVNVVDVWWCVHRPMDWGRVNALMSASDPRLTAPALWMAQHVMPDLVPSNMLAGEMDRLPRAARRALSAASPAEVLRDPSQRTSLLWRQSFAMSARERAAVVDQMLWPRGDRSLRSATHRLRGRR